jgi:poly(3-hydroxybutyrate) depolymerase
MAILDSLENNMNINTDSVFFMGFSMGGFMSNRMAIEHGDR